jgi:hypothetical protein
MIEIVRTSDSFSNKLPVFGTEQFLAAKSSEFGWFIDGACVLPFIIDKHLCFRRLIFTTEIIPLTRVPTLEQEKDFLDEVMRVCESEPSLGVDFVATAQANAVFRIAPSESEPIPWGSYIVDLQQSEDAMFNGCHSKHRNVIRNALGNGVEIRTTNDVGEIYRNIRDTMKRQNLLFFPSRSYLARLQGNLGGNLTFYTAYYKDVLQGAAVVAHNEFGGFYYYGGSIARPFTGSLNLMQYEIMKDLKRKGRATYDLMGARIDTGGDPKIEGIQRFKARFASSFKQGYTFRKIIRPVRHRLFVCAVKAYCAIKGAHYNGDVIDQAQGRVSANPPSRSENGGARVAEHATHHIP